MKSLLAVMAIVSVSLSFSASSAKASPLSECYDDAIAACGFLWPGQDSGDAGYASCIKSGMDLCDGAHKRKPLGLTSKPPRKPLGFSGN